MIEVGILTEEHRVELLRGQLIPKMPSGKPHAASIDRIADFLYDTLGAQYRIRVQNPVTLSDVSQPEPDLVVADRKIYIEHHPRPHEIHLLIEVSENSARYDRGSKKATYAAAGIVEYWIVDVDERVVEVHTRANVNAGVYNRSERLYTGQSFESGVCGQVAVDALLLPSDD